MLRQAIREALATATGFDGFSSLLLQKGVSVSESRGRLSYLTPDRTRPITARRLGEDFDRAAVLAALERNAQRGVTVRSTPLSIKDRLQAARVEIAARQGGVQRLMDIEQKLAEGKGKAMRIGRSCTVIRGLDYHTEKRESTHL